MVTHNRSVNSMTSERAKKLVSGIPGLAPRKEGGNYHIDKLIHLEGFPPYRCRGTLRTDDAQLAFDRYIARIQEAKEKIRRGTIDMLTVREAGVIYCDYLDAKPINKSTVKHRLDARRWLTQHSKTKFLDKHIGHLPINEVDQRAIDEFLNEYKTIDYGKNKGRDRKQKTLLDPCRYVVSMLRYFHFKVRDPHDRNLPYLKTLPVLDLPNPKDDARLPVSLTYDEQDKFLAELSKYTDPCGYEYLKWPMQFKLYTGLRLGEVHGLKREWIRIMDEPGYGSFMYLHLPKGYTKNGKQTDIPLNSIARAAVEAAVSVSKGSGSKYIFTRIQDRKTRRGPKGTRQGFYLGSLDAVRDTAKLLGLRDDDKPEDERFTPHGARHTFNQMLDKAGVSIESRNFLVGHENKRINAKYGRPELITLHERSQSIVRK